MKPLNFKLNWGLLNEEPGLLKKLPLKLEADKQAAEAATAAAEQRAEDAGAIEADDETILPNDILFNRFIDEIKLIGDHLSNLNEDIQAAKREKIKTYIMAIASSTANAGGDEENQLPILKDVKDTRGIWQVFSLIPFVGQFINWVRTIISNEIRSKSTFNSKTKNLTLDAVNPVIGTLRQINGNEAQNKLRLAIDKALKPTRGAAAPM